MIELLTEQLDHPAHHHADMPRNVAPVRVHDRDWQRLRGILRQHRDELTDVAAMTALGGSVCRMTLEAL